MERRLAAWDPSLGQEAVRSFQILETLLQGFDKQSVSLFCRNGNPDKLWIAKNIACPNDNPFMQKLLE